MPSADQFLDISVDDLDIPASAKNTLKKHGFDKLSSFQNIYYPDIYKIISLGAGKDLLRELFKYQIQVRFAQPDWSEAEWHAFVEKMTQKNIVSWKEIAMAVCGELNPPQVGTAIASNESFQAKFPPRQTMRAVMEWFYAQNGRCTSCGTRLFLEADHIRAKQDYLEAGEDPKDADRLDNLQLLCKRCNVIKRPSHALGGISFAPAQSVLIWILLNHQPKTKEEFYELCRSHGLTMANIRFDEAWAFAEWLRRENNYGAN